MSDLAHWELGNRLHSVFYPKEAAKKANRQSPQDVLIEGDSVRKIFMAMPIKRFLKYLIGETNPYRFIGN